MPEVKTLCPFCDYITECKRSGCTGCAIRIENTLRMDEQIAGNLKDLWACQQSGAEK